MTIDSMRHLRSGVCQFCGAATKSIAVNGLHTNGQQFESRTYHCGYGVEWSPNFSRMEVTTTCPKSEEGIAAALVEARDRSELTKALEGAELSEKFRKTVMTRLEWILR